MIFFVDFLVFSAIPELAMPAVISIKHGSIVVLVIPSTSQLLSKITLIGTPYTVSA